MTRKAADRWYQKLYREWHPWTLVKGILLGLLVGVPVGTGFTQNLWRTYRMIDNNSEEIAVTALIAILVGRMIVVARWPRTPLLDYNKITGWGFLASNFLTIVMALVVLILTLRLVAPGLLELLGALAVHEVAE